MALEHALLVALRERPSSGLELARRFDRSIGFFWHATHQQIYRVLARMEASRWVVATEVRQAAAPPRREYAVSAVGRVELARWLAEPSPAEPLRSDLAVRLRGAADGDRGAVLDGVQASRAEHATRLRHYEGLLGRDYPDPGELSGRELDQYLVLLGGIRYERFWVDWLDEYVAAHTRASVPA